VANFSSTRGSSTTFTARPAARWKRRSPALQIRTLFANAILVFVLPPSWDELRARLIGRGEDTPEVIELRLANAREELAQARHFDYLIINEIFERALFYLKAIVHAQRLKYSAQKRARADTFKALNID